MSGKKSAELVSHRTAQQERLLAAATEVFLDKGFSATTIDEIATAAKASKITFYNHFGNKEQLFEQVVIRVNERIYAGFAAALEGDISLEKGLLLFSRQMMSVLYSGEAVRLIRVLHSESERFPHLGEIFETAGPERARVLLKGFIRKKMEDGTLRKGDPDLAAEQFVHLALGELSRRLLLGFAAPSKEHMEKRLKSAVDVFQRAYARELIGEMRIHGFRGPSGEVQTGSLSPCQHRVSFLFADRSDLLTATGKPSLASLQQREMSGAHDLGKPEAALRPPVSDEGAA